MKTNKIHRNPASIAKTRWTAYATAGAASAFTCANSAEATIHYSGRINEFFGNSCDDKIARFQLDQPGDSILLRHSQNLFCFTFSYGGNAHFGIRGRAAASIAGFYNPCPSAHVVSVSKLSRGQFISGRPFVPRNSGVLASADFYCGSSAGQFDSGVGFIGFKFNNGSGDQYGWVRVKFENRHPYDHYFWLFDYAYADPGEPIRAGQTSSNEMVPEEGSLGGLALGAAGLLAWRKRRSRTARLEDA